MEDEIDLHKVPLTSLTYEARTLLCILLDSTKQLLSDGPQKLPRDWRGLAALIDISSEETLRYTSEPTAKVINYWIQRNYTTATVGQLLAYVQLIDRYDVFDDFVNLQAEGNLIQNQPRRQTAIAVRGTQALAIPDEEIEENLITFDDKIHGGPQFYHAYVLYAQGDKHFVDEMRTRLGEKNFRLCTEDDLLPDHQTTYAPVARLISSERCHRIVLVYSPEFLISPANQFYMNYAQAVGIEMKKPKIIPVMYRHCVLPPQVMFYHKLYYKSPGSKPSYNFWDRLAYSLAIPTRINGSSTTTSHSTLNITELSNNSVYMNGLSSQYGLLAIGGPSKSYSMNGLDGFNNGSADENQTSSTIKSNISSVSASRPSRFRRFFNTFKKKDKKSKKL